MRKRAQTVPPGFAIPGRGNGVLEITRYRYLLALLIRKGIRTRYHGSVLGWTWSYVKPAAQFAVFYLALGVFLQLNRGIENFAIYLFSGIIVINLFSEAFSNATRSIVDNAPLVQKIYLPRELFPIAAVVVAFVHFLPQVAVLTLVSIIIGWSPTWLSIGAILLGALLIVTLATGLGLFFGAINVSFRDSQNLVDLILLFATWTSPVLYQWTMVQAAVPTWLFNIYMANPITASVELFHYGFWAATLPAGVAQVPPNLVGDSLLGILICAAILVIGQLTFRRLEGRFAQDL